MKALEKVKVGDLLCCDKWPPLTRCRPVVNRTSSRIWVEYESAFFDLNGSQDIGGTYPARIATQEDLHDWTAALQQSRELAAIAVATAEAEARRRNNIDDLSKLLHLPWLAHGDYIGTDAEDSQTVAYVSNHRNRRLRNTDDSRAIAEFIVRACNSFDGMVEALQNMLGMFDTPVVRMHFNTEYHREACKSARDALLKGKT